jgi:hypothetical protein
LTWPSRKTSPTPSESLCWPSRPRELIRMCDGYRRATVPQTVSAFQAEGPVAFAVSKEAGTKVRHWSTAPAVQELIGDGVEHA